MLRKYYMCGDEHSIEGATLATTLVDDDGKPVIQFGSGPESLYKPVEITKEQAVSKFGGTQSVGLPGILNSEGKTKLAKAASMYKAMQVEKQERCFMHEANRIDREVAKGLLMEDEIDQELENRGWREGQREKIKNKRNKKPK